VSEIRSPWDHLPPPVVRARREKPIHDPDAPKTELGRKRKSAAKYWPEAGDDWLFHHLIVISIKSVTKLIHRGTGRRTGASA
jgi:hypothetical protein